MVIVLVLVPDATKPNSTLTHLRLAGGGVRGSVNFNVI
jgi:hypothetical protein